MYIQDYMRMHGGKERQYKPWVRQNAGEKKRRQDDVRGRNGYDKYRSDDKGQAGYEKNERYERSDKFGYDRNQYKRSPKESGWVPTCFNCQEKGHKANNCPKAKRAQDKPAQVKVVNTPSSIMPKYKIGANRCKMLLDSGANLSLVDARFVREDQYGDQVVEVRGVN